MTTRAEQAVAKHHVLIIGHEVTKVVCSFYCFIYLLCNQLVSIRIIALHTSEQHICNREEPQVVGSSTLQSGAALGLLVEFLHSFHHVVVVTHDGMEELIHLQLAQHAVDVKMIELQIEVGGNEVGEFAIVVLFVYLEQLCVAGGYDGKAFLAQLLTQCLIELF